MLDRIASLLKIDPPVVGDRGLLFASGATVPSDATDGYQSGCIFQHTDGGAGTVLYVNEGSVTSSLFVPIAAMTAAQEALLGATAGTAAASKAVILDASKNIISMGRITQGAVASVVGSGLVLATATPSVLLVCADDNGASIADSVFTIRGRTLLTFDQAGGSIRSVAGHLKLLTNIDVTTGIYTGVQGYVEMVGTHSAKTGSTFSCIDASAEIGTALTVDSGGEFCGIHVETTGAGTITNSGTCAGILIDMASGAAKWPDGIFIDGASVIMGLRIGKFAGSAATTSAVPFNATQNVYSDGQLSTMEVHGSSAADLTSAYSAKCIRARHVVSGTGLTIAHETYGIMGQLVAKGSTLTHLHSGLIGTFEGHTSGVVINGAYTYGAAAVMARVGGGAAIVATKAICGVVAFWNGAAIASGVGTIAFGADDSGTTLWAVGLGVSRATALFAVPAAGTAPTTAATTAMSTLTSEGYVTVNVGGAAKKVYYFA